MVFAGFSGFFHLLQQASHDLAAIWQRKWRKSKFLTAQREKFISPLLISRRKSEGSGLTYYSSCRWKFSESSSDISQTKAYSKYLKEDSLPELGGYLKLVQANHLDTIWFLCFYQFIPWSLTLVSWRCSHQNV